MKGYIYYIINIINGKRYIGKTNNIEHRLYNHFYDLKNGNHKSTKLQNAYNKYGKDNFKIEYQEYEINNEEELSDLEIQEIEKYDSFKNGYNMTLGGEGSARAFSLEERIYIHEIGKRYTKIATFLETKTNSTRHTIADILKDDQYDIYPIDENKFQEYVKKFELPESYLNDNYLDTHRSLTKKQIQQVFAILEFYNGYQGSCAKVLGVSKYIISGMNRGLMYPIDRDEYLLLSIDERKKIADEALQEYDLEHIRLQLQRGPVKNPLTQEQINYILDNKDLKSQAAIGRDLGISADRVRSVIKGISYKDLVTIYYKNKEQ